MILWLILAATSTANLIGLLLAGANEEYTARVRAISKEKLRAHWMGSLLLMLASLSIPVLWTWYAFNVRDWRFAAIAWVPTVAGWLLKLTVPSYGNQSPTVVRRP